MTFQIPATIEGMRTLKDGGIRLTIDTNELAENEMAKVFSLKEKFVWLAISETAIKEDELNIPEVMMEFKNEKTPSQRLRNTIFVYWSQYKPTPTFDEFYKQKMEQIISFIREKLN